ncbi:hypothetical protein OMAG_000432 [Candidatus Omnitrophus magneticus]|uniref:Uncharacterized protein n=1 Tax=Candidatus Omnitrophus magneticus TaxID=1609969 RepID=A0A0F0CKI0_9BACT|nr:hypothetical protein OMAG_002316 [Candidatus Omnitrophus magneticus]KJJ85697.1 hypothetical protein OMAG_000432 [Candidatus Omnitrophus magneticus]
MCWLYNSVISSFVHVPKRIDSALILKGEPEPNDASLGRTFVLYSRTSLNPTSATVEGNRFGLI